MNADRFDIEWGDATTIRIGEHELEYAEFDVDGVTFDLCEVAVRGSTPDRFSLAKNRSMLQRYLDLCAELPARRVVELGVYQGGSAALLGLMPTTEKLVAFELDTNQRGQALDQFIDSRSLKHKIATHYGIDQADKDCLVAVLAEEGLTQIDLVTDDASHDYAPTVASFDALFPLLRTGGVYVIEDWRWAHVREMDLGAAKAARAAVPLTTLVFELVMACGSRPDLIERVEVNKHMVIVTRGTGRIDATEGFSLRGLYDDISADLIGDWTR